MSIKIQIIKTGKVQEVSQKVAYDLINKGLALMSLSDDSRTGNKQEDDSLYLNRQMRASRRHRSR